MRILFGVVRLLAAVAIVAAVVAQLLSSLRAPDFFFFNFFGYFTIQSNLLVAVTMVLTGVWALRRGGPMPSWMAIAHGATAAYIATTGVVYNILLANIPASDFTVPWSNDIVHKWIPLIGVLEWVLFGDRHRIAFARLWAFLIYPFVWLIATLLRGQSFVPYPFLNTVTLGWGAVILYCIGIALFIGGMSALVIWLSRFRVLRD